MNFNDWADNCSLLKPYNPVPKDLFMYLFIYFNLDKVFKKESFYLSQTVGREANSAQSCDDEIAVITDTALPR